MDDDQLRRVVEPWRRISARTAWPLSFMYVSRERQHDLLVADASTRRPARRRGPAFSVAPARSASEPDGLLADVVAGAGVLLAGVAQPDDERVDAPSAAGSARRQALAGRCRRSAAASPPSAPSRLGGLRRGVGLRSAGAHDEHGDDRHVRVAEWR